MIEVAIAGVRGKMGKRLCELTREDPECSLTGGTVRTHDNEERDLGLLLGSGRWSLDASLDLKDIVMAKGGVLIDFTHPAALDAHIQSAVARNWALLVGTTGLRDAHKKAVAKAAKKIPVLVAANTSIGAELLSTLASLAGARLPHADCEIHESHHRQKIDSPSGTALALANSISRARKEKSARLNVNRSQTGARESGEIGIAALRGGDVIGEHTVHFYLDGERMELTHRVSDRSVFAYGAIRAAKFLARQSSGLFSMSDVLEEQRS